MYNRKQYTKTFVAIKKNLIKNRQCKDDVVQNTRNESYC